MCGKWGKDLRAHGYQCASARLNALPGPSACAAAALLEGGVLLEMVLLETARLQGTATIATIASPRSGFLALPLSLPHHHDSHARASTHPLPQYEYFDQPGSLRHMVLHAAADHTRGRGIYALHLPADNRWGGDPGQGEEQADGHFRCCLGRQGPKVGAVEFKDGPRAGFPEICLFFRPPGSCWFSSCLPAACLPCLPACFAPCRCQVWVVNPARGGQRELSGAAAERAWQEAAAAQFEQQQQQGAALGEAEGPPPAPHFELAYVKSEEAALRQIQKELGRIK